MVIGVQPTHIMGYIPSTKVGGSPLVMRLITHLPRMDHSYPSGRVFGTNPVLYEAHSDCGSERLA